MLAGAVLAWFLLTARPRPPAPVRCVMKAVLRSRWTRRGLLSLAVVALIFGFFFPKVADYGAVWDTLVDMTWLELGSLGARRGLEHRQLLAAAHRRPARACGCVRRRSPTCRRRPSPTPCPAAGRIGVGVTMTMQRSWGIPVPETALGMVVSGVWNNFVKLGLPVIALGLLALSGGASTAPDGRGPDRARRAGRGRRPVRPPAAQRAQRGRGRSAAAGPCRLGVRRLAPPWPGRGMGRAGSPLPHRRHRPAAPRWLRITITALISHISLFLVLLLALRHVGVCDAEVSWQEVLAAFAFVRLLSAVPLTPGGLGLVELGLTAALGSGLDDGTKSQIAAAVLLYRGLTWLLPVPLGVVTWLFWRANRSWRRTLEEREAELTVETVTVPDAPTAAH